MVCLELETCFKGDGEVRSPLSQTVGTVDFLYYKDSCSTVRTFNIFFLFDWIYSFAAVLQQHL